jgi:hypothetical protein
MVLQVLREYQLYAKLSKCSFYQKHFHYLGHIISEEGIALDPDITVVFPISPENTHHHRNLSNKIEDIRGWSMPKNVTKVRSFMGLTRYYRIFIEGFSKISHPITSLQNKGVKFQWAMDCENNFQQLNHLLTSSPILRIVDQNEDFIVCIDACKEGLGGVLSQNGYVV